MGRDRLGAATTGRRRRRAAADVRSARLPEQGRAVVDEADQAGVERDDHVAGADAQSARYRPPRRPGGRVEEALRAGAQQLSARRRLATGWRARRRRLTTCSLPQHRAVASQRLLGEDGGGAEEWGLAGRRRRGEVLGTASALRPTQAYVAGGAGGEQDGDAHADLLSGSGGSDRTAGGDCALIVATPPQPGQRRWPGTRSSRCRKVEITKTLTSSSASSAEQGDSNAPARTGREGAVDGERRQRLRACLLQGRSRPAQTRDVSVAVAVMEDRRRLGPRRDLRSGGQPDDREGLQVARRRGAVRARGCSLVPVLPVVRAWWSARDSRASSCTAPAIAGLWQGCQRADRDQPAGGIVDGDLRVARR